MGACDFMTRAEGKTAREAFRDAVEHARYEYGHGGYTGTIAEKSDFVMASPKLFPESEAYKFAREQLDEYDDKWGPAGCIEFTPERQEGNGRWFLFFGWASS